MIESILFAIAMVVTISLLIYLFYMNLLIYTLYDFGLQFSYDWASRYYSMLRLGFALLSIMVITSVGMYILSRRRISQAKTLRLEREGDVQTLTKGIQQLRLELWRYKRKPSGTAGYILLLLGAVALALSMVYASSILALIGLGLTFWGVLLSMVRPVRYVKSSLLDSTAFSSLTTVDRIITDLGYEGKGIHLPPRYLKGLKTGTVFIPFKKELIIPTLDEVSKERVFLENPKGICLTPSGSELVNLFEKELGTNFAKVDLNYLQNNLPKLFVEGLEIAKDFEMKTYNDTIIVKITESVYKDFCSEVRTKLSNVCNSLGCPLCSSIACALTRSTGKPIIIEKNELSTDGKVIEAYYRILETRAQKKDIARALSTLLQKRRRLPDSRRSAE